MEAEEEIIDDLPCALLVLIRIQEVEVLYVHYHEEGHKGVKCMCLDLVSFIIPVVDEDRVEEHRALHLLHVSFDCLEQKFPRQDLLKREQADGDGMFYLRWVRRLTNACICGHVRFLMLNSYFGLFTLPAHYALRNILRCDVFLELVDHRVVLLCWNSFQDFVEVINAVNVVGKGEIEVLGDFVDCYPGMRVFFIKQEALLQD